MMMCRGKVFLHCVYPPLFALCSVSEASGGLLYMFNCHYGCCQHTHTQHYLSYCSLICASQNVTAILKKEKKKYISREAQRVAF